VRVSAPQEWQREGDFTRTETVAEIVADSSDGRKDLRVQKGRFSNPTYTTRSAFFSLMTTIPA
jgi:hypothetical protein